MKVAILLCTFLLAFFRSSIAQVPSHNAENSVAAITTRLDFLSYSDVQLEKRKKKKTPSSSIFVLIPTVATNKIATDSAFVDIYNCKEVNVLTLDGLSNVKYGCLNEARASFLINQGRLAITNLTALLSDYMTYEKNYKAYVDVLQKSILSEFGEWFFEEKGRHFYRCGKKANANLFEYLVARQTFHKEDLCALSVSKVKNAYIVSSNKTSAAANMSKFYNRTLSADTLDAVTSKQSILVGTKNFCSFTLENVTAPKGVNFQGAHICEVEKEQRAMMIANIILSLIGVFTVFLGGTEAAISNLVLGAIQIATDFAVPGTITGDDAKNILLQGVLDIFGAFSTGKLLGEAANIFRFRKTRQFGSKMNQFSLYRTSLEKIYDLSIDITSNSANL